MTAVRITKLERDERGFYTANVTPEGGETVRVDNRIGCWTIPVNPADDYASNKIRRREVLPEIARALWKRVKAHERGEAVPDEEVSAKTNGRRRPANAPVSITPEAIAAEMAAAASQALKEAA